MSTEDADRLDLHCSFCGKARKQVRSIIAGPKVFICDECVLLCADVLIEQGIPVPTPPDQEEDPPAPAADGPPGWFKP